MSRSTITIEVETDEKKVPENITWRATDAIGDTPQREKALRSLRAIKAAILLAKTSEGAGGELKNEDETKLLQKLVKQRKDSLEIYQQQNRTDLAQKEQEEIEIIEKFLPKQLSPEELKAALLKIITETGASSPADMGKVMGVAT